VALAVRDLVLVERSRGHPGLRGRALLGALGGFVTGVLIGVLAPADGGCADARCSDPRPGLAAFFGALGAGVGVLIPTITTPERWEPILDRRGGG
jgi:hypothetical protein